MPEFLNSIARGLGQLILPERCISCGAGESSICVACKANLKPRPQRFGGEKFPLAASLFYDESTARIILAAKEDGSRAARIIVSEAIAAATLLLIERGASSPIRQLHLVWIPSSKRARRRRGGDFLEPITHQVAAIIDRQLDIQVGLAPLLHVRRAVMDQSDLTAVDRDRNLHSAFSVRPGWKGVGHLLLVDDVVTTGSTLREAVRALHERNLTVIGAATACASRLRKPLR